MQPASDFGSDHHSGNPSLQQVALRARVRALTGGSIELAADAVETSVAGAVLDDGRAFYQSADERGLGPALRWAVGRQASTLDLIADAPVAGHLARRVGLLEVDRLGLTDVRVWAAAGPAVERAEAAPLAPPPPIPVGHEPFAAVMAEAGARPVDDHGMLVAEVAGLEVARVVDASDESGGVNLDVGVGQADRELQAYVHGHLDDDTNLRRAIAAVVRDRHPGAAQHPLSRLARQRWLRSVLLDDPAPVGVAHLEPLPPLRPRTTLLGTEPAAAQGDGVIVVCSVGVDLDLIPEAVDYRLRDEPDADVIVVVPERDRHLVSGPPAAAAANLRVVSIPHPWGD